MDLASVHRAAALLALAFVAGCSSSDVGTADVKDSGGEVIATCDSLIGGTVTVELVCASCGVRDEQAVADDDPYSFASIEPGPGDAFGIRVRVTATDGRIFPAGSDAGAFYTGPENTDSTQVGMYQMQGVRTYLDGVQQETDVYGEDGNTTFNDANVAPVPTRDAAAPRTFRWIHTTKDFDAVEFVVQNVAGSGNDSTWKLHELCSNGWVKS